MRKKLKHSEAFLTEYRDFWWNHDFLELMAKRWNLKDANSIADLGCGLGHWSRLLYQFLKPNSKLVGVDLEPKYVKKAPAEFQRTYPKISKKSYSFVVGDAVHIPLQPNSFDVVTCQTLLIHLKSPEKALKEMVRIAKPGGLIICAEPNNIFEGLDFNSLTAKKSVESLVKIFEYLFRYERGKTLLGEGNNSLGDLLPGLFAQLGLKDIKVFQSDKALPIFPPYKEKEQQILLKQLIKWKREGVGGWDKKTSKKRIMTGGASERFFETMWQMFERDFKVFQNAVKRKQYHKAGGDVFYLVSGRKNK